MIWEPLDRPRIVDPFGASSGDVPEGFSIATLQVRGVAVDSPPPDLRGLPLVDATTIETQRSAARLEEHAAGRAALAHLLTTSDRYPTGHRADRDASGRPTLDPPSVSFSIAHDDRLAIAAIADPAWSIGIDLEPAGRVIADGVLEWISIGDERATLGSSPPPHRLDAWLAKEAACKAAGATMSESAKAATWRPEESMVVWTEEVAGPTGQFRVEHASIESDGSSHRFCLAWRCD